jgi:hypothetical protein
MILEMRGYPNCFNPDLPRTCPLTPLPRDMALVGAIFSDILAGLDF